MASEPKVAEVLAQLGRVVDRIGAAPGGWDALVRDYDTACRELAAVTAERDRLWLALERVRMYIKDDHEFERTGRELSETGAPKGRTHPRPCSICRREDCTVTHECE